MQSLSSPITSDSRMPRSTTRASSIASSLGGPDSKSGDASGISSAAVIITPLSGESEYGSPISILIPAITWVLPILTLADPSAFEINPVSISIFLNSSNFLSSARFPFFARLYK